MSMQEELRRCNSLGDVKSIYEVAKIAIVKHQTDVSSVSAMCMFNSRISVKPRACLLFFAELGLITITAEEVTSTSIGLDIVAQDYRIFVRRTAELTLNYLFDNEIVSLDSISIDSDEGKYLIKKSAFPLSVAAFRNYLLDSGLLEDFSASFYELAEPYEPFFEESVRLRRGTVTLEKLKELQEQQAEQGRRAEVFVVEFEKKRLCGHPKIDKIRQISDFDVTAGFDILSFENQSSIKNDRFIEV